MALFPDNATPPLADDRATLERFRAGDRVVLEALYRVWRPRVDDVLRHGFRAGQGGAAAVRGLTDEALRHDLLHDTFVKAFAPDARLSYDGVRPFGGWLFMIAKNTTLSWLDRAENRKRGGSLDDDEAGGAWAPVDSENAEGLALDAELGRVTAEFVASLGAEERAIVESLFGRADGDDTQERLAQRLGLSRPTLRKRERAVQARFEAHLRACGYLEGRGAAGARVAELAAWLALGATLLHGRLS